MPERDGKTILIMGAGGIGPAAALMLLEWADFEVARIYLADLSEDQLRKATDLLSDDPRAVRVHTAPESLGGGDEALARAFEEADVVLDCLPGKLAPAVARRALEARCHYVNLTEYVEETRAIEALAREAPTAFLLQTGLAPGFVNVLAMKLYRAFVAEQGERVHAVEMRVGALTKEAHPPHYYGFTWSPVGVATEYLEPCVVVRGGRVGLAPALSERRRVILGGVTYEEDLTSGGAANLPDFLAGKAHRVDYKTLRYPGHYDWVAGVIAEVGRDVAALQQRMEAEIPRVKDDVVVIHAAAEGHDAAGARHRVARSYSVGPVAVGRRTLTAIQATTAAGLVESARLVLTGGHRGIVHQSDIEPEPFLAGTFVGRVYA